MKKEKKAKTLLVKVEKGNIGLLSALMDGSGRNAIVRTKERDQNLVYLIATPDTYQNLMSILENIKKHLDIEILGPVEEIDVG